MTYYISQQSDLQAYPDNKHNQFYQTQVTKGVWKQATGIDLYYAIAHKEQAAACVVISVGRAESVSKYAEVIYEMHQNNFSVFIFDHQGQGRSSRILENRQIGYVANFSDYVDDMHTLLHKVLTPLLVSKQQDHLPKYLLCHSMGGAIGSLYVQQYPTMFNKLVLCSPMFGIVTPLPEWAIKCIIKLTIKFRQLLRLPMSYIWRHGDYYAYPFAKNRLTHSEVRYREFRAVMTAYPEEQLGGISYDWLSQAISAMQNLRQQMDTILLPCLILQAQQDQVVDNKMIQALAATIANCELIEVANARHEILFEQDPARTYALTKILDFFVAK